MDDNFKFRAAARTVDELNERIVDQKKYLPETVEASVNELQHRGYSFTEEQLQAIAAELQARRTLAATPQRSFFAPVNKNTQVEDPDAPAFYPKQAILGFSILFSALFAAILLAINVAKTPNKNKLVLIVLFGLIYTGITYIIVLNIPSNAVLILIFGYFGAFLLDILFWKPYIGNTTFYRPKPIWIPLIIALAITLPLIILYFQNP